ncbi:unnamed protein product [Prorocentrum cordatum]|uniref:Uncharacterized protein n=1 Tax=Prorocentrum cordatum TaxID=2364126 RepID=A0ABN9WUU3_9DINO|nr:unnamed protein product [Polarella glacialis]
MRGSKYDAPVASHFLNCVRALPVQRGTVLAWSHRILHWGSASPVEAPEARKTLTFAMAAPAYEKPLIELGDGELPPFGARLALVAYTLVCYHHSAPVTPEMQRDLVEVLRRHSHHLTPAALLQATGESFFKSLAAFCRSSESQQAARIEELGAQMLGRLGMKSDWWALECSGPAR